MNKKIFIIISSIVVSLTTVVILMKGHTKTYDVSLGIDNSLITDIKIDIYRDEDQDNSEHIPIDTNIPIPSTIKLPEGVYSYKVVTGGFIDATYSFQVTKESSSIKLQPSLNTDSLDKLTKRESDKIKSSILDSNEFSFDKNKDSIVSIKLYLTGGWAGVTLLSSRGPADLYHIILRKEGDQWIVKTKPLIVINSLDYPEIPEEILSDINSQQSSDNTSETTTDTFTGDGAPPNP